MFYSLQRKGCLLLLLVALCINGVTHADIVNKSVANVNGEVITLKDFEKITKPYIEQYSPYLKGEDTDEKIKVIKTQILNQMIEEKLLLQEAKALSIKVADIDIVQEMKKIMEGFGFTKEEDFFKELKKEGLSEDEFRKEVKDGIMREKVIDQQVRVKVTMPTDKDVEEYYIANKEKIKEPEQVRIRHILIKVSAKAEMQEKSQALNRIKEIKKKIKDGENFSELAKQYSDDIPSKERGGDLGYFVKGAMVKEFEQVAFNLNEGGISDIVETDFGYHILKCEGKKSERNMKLEDEVEVMGNKMKVKEFIRNSLYQERGEKKLTEWIQGLRDKGSIEIKNFD